MEDFFYKLEAKLLSKVIRASKIELDTLIDDDFLEFGTSGRVYNKEFILEKLPESEFSETEINNFSIFIISDEIVQTRFQTIESDKRMSLRSSIWKKYSNDDWRILFHQGTLLD